MTEERDFEGGCLCGDIRYRSTGPPLRGVICHCSMCRKHTGSLIMACVHFPIGAFTWLGPEPTRYQSSEYAGREFCPRCGSTLSVHEDVLPDRVRIDDHVWTREKVSWFEIGDDLPRFEKSSTAVPTKADN